ncbi:hypothetical protein Poli38472_009835 [Pythium oligandrum]|uniref:Uncharacterized protein n=1 Tax=Pythium oligandrum TaxID=41045 RepID=A0A8K1FK08_PYTOL|nr:hypothetical protein Poli38472_009835 [Pythium oligandrum]|eukprot:TMW62342.1 hypothetical protein Poli38472_009835 [Pythium oligandrum]
MSQRLISLREKYLARWSTNAYKMEYNGFFSNHLLHGVTAICELGASEKRVEEYGDHYTTKLCPVNKKQEVKSVALKEAKPLLGQRTNFEGLRAMYEDEIQRLTVDGAVKKHLPTLVGGLAGSLLHGIIQLGYAYHVGGDLLIAEGLAYLHFSYLAFDDPNGEDSSEMEKVPFTREAAFKLVRRVRDDPKLLQELHTHLKEPAITKLSLGSLQPRVMSFSSDPVFGDRELFQAIASVVDSFDLADVDGDLALDFISWLYLMVPQNDFVILHATTSAWSLAQVDHLLSAEDRLRAWKVWFRVALSAYIAHEVPELPEADICVQSEAELPTLSSWEEIIANTLALEGDVDEHVYKMVQVVHEHATKAHQRKTSFLSEQEREYVMKKAAIKVIGEEFTIEVSST